MEDFLVRYIACLRACHQCKATILDLEKKLLSHSDLVKNIPNHVSALDSKFIQKEKKEIPRILRLNKLNDIDNKKYLHNNISKYEIANKHVCSEKIMSENVSLDKQSLNYHELNLKLKENCSFFLNECDVAKSQYNIQDDEAILSKSFNYFETSSYDAYNTFYKKYKTCCFHFKTIFTQLRYRCFPKEILYTQGNKKFVITFLWYNKKIKFNYLLHFLKSDSFSPGKEYHNRTDKLITKFPPKDAYRLKLFPFMSAFTHFVLLQNLLIYILTTYFIFCCFYINNVSSPGVMEEKNLN